MKLSLVVVVVAAAVLAMALAQAPCITPAALYGRASEYDHEHNSHTRIRFTYDQLGERIRVVEEIEAGTPGRAFYEFLALYRNNIEYRIDLSTRNCTHSTPRRPWRPFGVPPNATFDGLFNIGGMDETITVSEWHEAIPGGPMTWIGSFTDRRCIPVRQIVAANITDSISTQFYDIGVGIPDPNVFIPPAECLRAF